MRRLFIILLSVFCSVTTSQTFARSMPIQAFQKCCGMKTCIEYPLRDTDLFVTSYSDQIFLHTNRNGVFYIDNTIADKMILAYLAEGETILVGCRSIPTLSRGDKVVLQGLCPMDNCKVIQKDV
jgi:hypothetical protein